MVSRRSFQALLAATVVGALLFLGSAAGAVDNPDYTAPPPTTPTTTPPTVGHKVTQPKHVETAVAVTPVRSRLAITGSDVGQTAAFGAGLVLIGGIVLVARRRPTVA